MDFELSEDQAALAEGVESLLRGRFDFAFVRELRHVPGAVDRDRWSELADTGVFSLAVSEEAGGLGLGWADAAVVFEQLGRFAVPGPLVANALCAELVDGCASGASMVGVVDRTGDASGAVVVEHASVLDGLVSLADDGVRVHDLSALDLVDKPIPLDWLTPVATTEVLDDGEVIADAATAVRLRTIGSVLTGALQLGLAAGATELAVAYAKEREQFGKVIGQFQAVKHLCADMASRVEVARAAVYFAAVSLDDPEIGDAAHAAAVARIVAGEAASANGKDGIQVHGGMGYTAEVDAHLFLKRAWVHDTQFGDHDSHAELVAASL